MNKKNKYKIACTWQMWGVMEVEAETLEEAEELAEYNQPLPKGDYVDSSFELDKDYTFYGRVD